MFYKITFSFLFIILNVQTHYAQKISGRILDSETKEELAFASVFLLSENDTLKTLSDFDGNYMFDNLKLKEYKLMVEYIGFKGLDQSVLLEKDTVINLYLREDIVVCGGGLLATKSYGKEGAKIDWEKGAAYLYYTLDKNRYSDRDINELKNSFYKKYKVHLIYFFWEEGVFKYQKTICGLLDKNYGKNWRKEIKKTGAKLKKKKIL